MKAKSIGVYFLSLLLFTLSFPVYSKTDSINQIIDRIQSSPNNFVEIQRGTSQAERVFLLVQGITFGTNDQWVNPIQVAIETQRPVYFYKIDKTLKLDQIVNQLLASLNQLKVQYPDAFIEVLAFSAGGAASLVAWSKLSESDLDNMQLTTMASPLAGYGMHPLGAPFVRLFAGAYTLQLARGFRKELGNLSLRNCRQIINTDCSRDPHACTRGEPSNPQLLSYNLCGAENFYSLQETHEGLLNKIVPILVKPNGPSLLRELFGPMYNNQYFDDL